VRVLACIHKLKGLFLMRVINPFLMLIWVENENIGTTSEENGSFSIHVEDQNKVLIFSALGFEKKS
jgi:hypothetical protein